MSPEWIQQETANRSLLIALKFEQGIPLQVHGLCLCVCNQVAYADNLADTVDRLLICLRHVSLDLHLKDRPLMI